MHPIDDLVSADLLDAEATADAIAGSSVAYLVAGLKYDPRVWQAQWPTVMRNTIEGCKRHGSALVFFDNVYAYGRVDGMMTEDTPYNPCSCKSDVRASIATVFMDEVKRRELQGMMVRSADFYGPGAVLSATHATVTERGSHRSRWRNGRPTRGWQPRLSVIPQPSKRTRISSLKTKRTATPLFRSDVGDSFGEVPAVAIKVLSIVLALAVGLVVRLGQDGGSILPRALTVTYGILDPDLNDM
jgi:hypothetical protein